MKIESAPLGGCREVRAIIATFCIFINSFSFLRKYIALIVFLRYTACIDTFRVVYVTTTKAGVSMAVSLKKVQEEAPHLVSLVKETMGVSLQKGLDLQVDKAAVVATFDDSGSAKPLYDSGEMQRVADMCFAAGLVFDDDGSVPVSFFDSYVQDLGEITLGNCNGFIAKQRPAWGSTSYSSALRWIIDQAGYGNVDLGAGGASRGGFFGRNKPSGGPLQVKANAAYPTFAIFVTDGEPNRDDEGPAADLLVRMSQLPIFVQFVGVGPHRFEYLRNLDDLGGRLIDNAGFFDSKDARDTKGMLEGLLNEFPTYLKAARASGLVTS